MVWAYTFDSRVTELNRDRNDHAQPKWTMVMDLKNVRDKLTGFQSNPIYFVTGLLKMQMSLSCLIFSKECLTCVRLVTRKGCVLCHNFNLHETASRKITCIRDDF